MKPEGDSTATSGTIHLGDMTASEARSFMLSQPTGTWFVHNEEISLIEECKWCGDLNGHDYIQNQCWKCWRNRHPGALE